MNKQSMPPVTVGDSSRQTRLTEGLPQSECRSKSLSTSASFCEHGHLENRARPRGKVSTLVLSYQCQSADSTARM